MAIDEDISASTSTTYSTGGVEAPLQVSVLYNRCCACFKCWLQVAKLRLYSYYCAKLGLLAWQFGLVFTTNPTLD